MDVWYRLELLVRSWTQAYRHGDQDFESAWEDLERFLNSEVSETSTRNSRRSAYPSEIRQAYNDLEIPVGTEINEIRRAYRQLLLRYHPDRHTDDPDKQQTAIEITQRLSMAYQRLSRYHS